MITIPAVTQTLWPFGHCLCLGKSYTARMRFLLLINCQRQRSKDRPARVNVQHLALHPSDFPTSPDARSPGDTEQAAILRYILREYFACRFSRSTCQRHVARERNAITSDVEHESFSLRQPSTYRCHPRTTSSSHQLIHQGHGDAGTGRTNRMPNCYSSPVDVGFFF